MQDDVCDVAYLCDGQVTLTGPSRGYVCRCYRKIIIDRAADAGWGELEMAALVAELDEIPYVLID